MKERWEGAGGLHGGSSSSAGWAAPHHAPDVFGILVDDAR